LLFCFSLFILDERDFWCHCHKKDEKKVELGEFRNWRTHFNRIVEDIMFDRDSGMRSLEGTFAFCVCGGRERKIETFYNVRREVNMNCHDCWFLRQVVQKASLPINQISRRFCNGQKSVQFS
jgi:hypothetical protein